MICNPEFKEDQGFIKGNINSQKCCRRILIAWGYVRKYLTVINCLNCILWCIRFQTSRIKERILKFHYVL